MIERARKGISTWVKSRPRLYRHVFSLRHLRHLYRSVGGELELAESDLFLHELPQRKEFFRRAFQYLAFNQIEGDYAEFGCFGAMTFRVAWSASRIVDYRTHLWGFDSFDGLPATDNPKDQHPRWTANWLSTSAEDFDELCRSAGLARDDYTTVSGYYEDSLRLGAEGARPERISFAYVDCDLYSSTVDVLSFLETRLVPGSVVGFDDWFCYSPKGPSGERLAALEHFANSQWSLVPFVQYGWHGMSFLVEETASVPPPVGPW